MYKGLGIYIYLQLFIYHREPRKSSGSHITKRKSLSVLSVFDCSDTGYIIYITSLLHISVKSRVGLFNLASQV